MFKVSFIIPTFNRGALLTACLENLREQTMADWEAIIVDDGSTDNTETIAIELTRREPRFRYERMAKNGGAQIARNRGFELSSGEFICLLDSDDIIHPLKLERQIARLAETGADVTVCQMAHFRETPADAEFLWNTFQGPHPLERFLAHDVVWGIHAPLWRRSAIAKIFPLDTSLPNAQDLALHLDGLASGLRFDLVPELLAYCRDHDGPSIGRSSTRRLDTLARVYEGVRQKLESRGELTPERREILAVNALWLATRVALEKDIAKMEAHIATYEMLSTNPRAKTIARGARWRGRILCRTGSGKAFLFLMAHCRKAGDIDARMNWLRSHKMADEPGLVTFPF